MLMVIFGAGASHGSRPGDSLASDQLRNLNRPPLTRELLDERYGEYAARYPSSRPAIVALRKALSDDPNLPIETAIAELYEAASGSPERARHLLALRFYLWDLLRTVSRAWRDGHHGFTHYTDLLDRIGTWRDETGEPIVLVTFNYDELLDRSIEDQVGNWQLRDFSSYVARSDWQLFKLHGSVGWSRVLKTNISIDRDEPNDLIAQSAGLDFDQGELRAVPWKGAVKHAETAVAVPGIAVPTTLKQTFQCPPDHIQKFEEHIPSIDRLLLVGWRAAEPHIQRLLASGIPPGYHLGICDCSMDDVQTIAGNLGLAAKRSPDLQDFTGGFSGLLEGNNLDQWLSLPNPSAPL